MLSEQVPLTRTMTNGIIRRGEEGAAACSGVRGSQRRRLVSSAQASSGAAGSRGRHGHRRELLCSALTCRFAACARLAGAGNVCPRVRVGFRKKKTKKKERKSVQRSTTAGSFGKMRGLLQFSC